MNELTKLAQQLGLPFPLTKEVFQLKNRHFELAVIEDLDHAIDMLCAHLEREKNNSSIKSERDLVYEQFFKEDLCPYYGRMWPAGLGLAQYLHSLPEDLLNQQKILELGAGLALPSFVAAEKGAIVTATDFHPDVEVLFDFNVRHLGLEKNCHYQRLNWTEPTVTERYPWVMASDVLYEGRHPEQIAEALLRFVAPGGHLLLADPGRGQLQRFVSLMEKNGAKTELFPQTLPPHYGRKELEIREVFLFHFRLA